jgi:exonuclease SbcC
MRLQSIEIENITSLKGKHFIDFENILKEGELFAITGPTGSGKSSILSAISLALYGKNYKKSLDSKDFVTLGQSSASIKLNFSTKGEEYCATWQLKVLKKNGTPIKKPSPQRILTKDSVAIDQSADQVIGLTFDQFIRSVVLNQGQFSKFITSNFSERRKILERLYSENEISELNKRLRESNNKLNQEIDLLEVKLDQSLPYSEEEIIEAKQNLPDLNESKDIASKHFKTFQNLGLQLKDFIELSSKRLESHFKNNENQKNLTISNDERNQSIELQKKKTEEFDAFKANYEIKSSKLNIARGQQSKFIHIKETIKTSKEEITKKEEKQIDLELQIKDRNLTNEELTKSRDLLKKNNSLAALNSEELKEVETTYLELKSTNANNEIHKKNLLIYESELEKLTQEGKTESEKIENILSKKNELAKKQTKNNFSNKTKQQIENEIAELENKLQSKNELLSKIEVYKTQLTEFESKVEELSSTKTREELKERLKEFNLKQEDLEKNKSIFDLEKNKHTLLELVDKSIEANSCQLCGQETNEEELTKIKTNLNRLLQKSVTKEDIDELDLLVKNLSTKVHTLKIKTINEDTEISELKEKILNLNQLISKSSTNTEEIDQIKDQISSIKNSLKELSNFILEYEIKSQRVKNLRSSFSEKNKQLSELKELIETNELSSISKLEKINKLTNTKLDLNKLEILKQQISQAMDQLDIEKQIAHNQDFITQFQKQSFENDESIKQLTKSIIDLSTEKEKLSTSIKEVTLGENIEDLLSELENKRESKSDELKNVTKKASMIETNYTRLLTVRESITDQIKVIENSLMSILGNLGPLFKEASLYKSKNHETNIFVSKSLLLKSYIENAEGVEAFKRANEFLVYEETESLRTYIEESLQEITKLDEKIKLFDEKSQQQVIDKKKLKELKATSTRYKNLIEVLGKNKDEFRNFVLGFIEKQLILATNGELNSICDGRYELIQKESTHGHEFFIVDSWNGGLERKVSTLSGGETFLVSLAMALSLAEMTRGQVDIDCFFIDEGFGSLDKDSIEDAFNALMSVRSRGKQIGIISHIQELTDRIAANIQLNKSNDGQSKIDIIFN